MQTSKQSFIELCINNNILSFGEFRLKSGRISPYFFNIGLFNNGFLLGKLAGYYANLIAAQFQQAFMLYGPAYKGIPLATATAVQLATAHNMQIDYAFNRKQPKQHGESGNIVGAPLQGDVIIIDDVITAGTSVSEAVDVIRNAGATPAAVVIALDRQETAADETLSAVQAVEKSMQIPVHAIIQLSDLIVHLQQSPSAQQHAAAIIEYRNRYGR